MATLFSQVYDRFFDKITDDMYVELTEQDTKKDCQSLLINAIPKFEFPKKSLTYQKEDFSLDPFNDESLFIETLTEEEIDILANLMVSGWLQRQIMSIDNTRQQYYGNTFKLTSQASHLNALVKLKEDLDKDNKKQQRLYSRRQIDQNGNVSSRWAIFNTYK